MGISLNQFNPIGYKSQTPEGKNYQKSNIGKTIALAGILAIDYFERNNKYLKQFSIENVFKNDLKINIPNKYIKPIKILSIAIDLSFAYGIGNFIDKQINKQRIKNLSSNNIK